MSLFCGSACQARKDQQAQASLLQAQAQANLLNSIAKGDNTIYYIIGIVAVLIIAATIWAYIKFKK